jgi:hypothetical protein
MTSPKRSLAGGLLLLFLFFGFAQSARAIPAFARKYGLPCSACHEAWPKLNTFGQTFKDNGYQIGNEKDAPIFQQPAYWPIALRITPHWHFEGAGHTATDSIPGDPTSASVEQTINSHGFDISGVDILTAGTLAKNISFLLVPTIDGESGTVGVESANVRLDDLWGSKWLNFKFGKFELDNVLSEKRILTLSGSGGFYQLYHYTPFSAPNTITDINLTSEGDNQLGVELSGHSPDDRTRYAATLVSSGDGTPGLPTGRTYSSYLHFSQAFLVPHLGLQRVGAYGFFGLEPTYFLTSGGVPIASAGRGNRSFYRVGVYGSAYIGKFDVTGVYQRSLDNVYLATATAANTTLPIGSHSPQWNTGTIEAHYTYSPQLIIIGRYELVRVSQQVFDTSASDLGNLDAFTIGYRYYPFMHSRAGLAWHQEFASIRTKGTSSTGADQRVNSYFMGLDFAF